MLCKYFDQFNVIRIITIDLGGEDWSIVFSNISIMLTLTVILILLLFTSVKLIPSKWGIIMELVYNNMRSLVFDNLGSKGQKFFPFILCIFLFISVLNILGLFPYVFTITAHIVVTFGMSLSIMIGVTLLGFLTFRVEYFSILVPGGVPLVLAPFLVVIETLSYMIRAISLGARLAANISAGHLLSAILLGFAFNLLLNGFYIIGLFPVLIMVFITLLEMMVAIIQAYVFSLLTTIYLSDTIALH